MIQIFSSVYAVNFPSVYLAVDLLQPRILQYFPNLSFTLQMPNSDDQVYNGKRTYEMIPLLPVVN